MSRARKRNAITADDIRDLSVEQLAAEPTTKASYLSYITQFVQFAIDRKWTSKHYLDSMHSTEELSAQYVLDNDIKPICSSINVEIYFKEFFDKKGRRQGHGVTTRGMADQFMKAAQYYRLMEFSRNLYKLQTQDWMAANTEFANKSDKVLRNQTICNLLEGFSKRQHRDELIRCVDTQPGKRHLNGHELLIAAKWAFEQGTPEAIRIHAVTAMARAAAFRVECTKHLKLRNLKYDILVSVASGLSEIPALVFIPDDTKENHHGNPEVTGCLAHVNPLLCPVAALGQNIVSQFHPSSLSSASSRARPRRGRAPRPAPPLERVGVCGVASCD